jgi:Na+-driven multidrug efflux pump
MYQNFLFPNTALPSIVHRNASKPLIDNKSNPNARKSKSLMNTQKKILKIGIPAAGEQVCHNTSQLAITAMIAILGTPSLTTRVYTQNIMSYIMLIGLAMGYRKSQN